MQWLMNIADKMDQPAQFLGLVLSRRTGAAQNCLALALLPIPKSTSSCGVAILYLGMRVQSRGSQQSAN
jgi:hypothetical protein